MIIGLTVSTCAFGQVTKATLTTQVRLSPGVEGFVSRYLASLQTLPYDRRFLALRGYTRGLKTVFYMTTTEIVLSAVVSLLMHEDKLQDNP